MPKNTLAQDYQDLLYQLLNTEIMTLDGKTEVDDSGRVETYIAKSELLDAFITVLNEVGKTMSEDKRLKNKDNDGI